MGSLSPALSSSTTTAAATSISNLESSFLGNSLRATASKCSVRVDFPGNVRLASSSSNSRSIGCRAQAQAVETPSQQQEAETIPLGQSEVRVPKIGIGSWSWGDQVFWHEGGWDDKKARGAKDAFDASLDVGLPFFDTAEVYGQKLPWGGDDSESLLGRFIKERQGSEGKVVVATKFAAYPWRLGRGSVVSAIKSSLQRLGLPSIDLYQLHWPGLWGNEGYIDGLGDAVEQGLVKAVGVSNYKESRLRDAHAQLKKRGITLASNQVHYSLAYRVDRCK